MMKKLFFKIAGLTLIAMMLSGCGNDTGGTQPAQDSKVSAESTNSGTEASKNEITQDEAKRIAFDDAGVEENDVTSLRIRRETDDGVGEYEVEFYVANKEYEYEIDVTTGEIRSKDIDHK